VIKCLPTGALGLGEIKSVETMIKNEKHYEYAQECAPRVEYLILKLKIIR
jgi:hypothetical protein